MIKERLGTEVGLVANRMRRKLRNGASKLSDIQSSMAEGTRRCARQTDYLVHENAWKLIGITAAVAIVGGFFLARKYGAAILGETNGMMMDQAGQTRPIKVKKVSRIGLVQSLLPFALFVLNSRKEAKVPERVELTA